MTLDLSAVGYETEAFHFEYDLKTTILYALGIGCQRDELDYLYEGRGPRVVPSFAVVPTYPALAPLVERAGADMSKVVHGAQSITLHAPIPAQGSLRTVAKIDGIYDFKRLSQVVFSTKTYARESLLFETEWMLVVRDTGGFGGPRPPKAIVVKVPLETPPDFEREQVIPETQALLYRLSGDLNPLHADPEFARAVGFDNGPILHGLCTFGYVARAVLFGPCAARPERLRHMNLQFKKPVWPGDSLRVASFGAAENRWALTAHVAERPEPVVSGWAQVDPS
jgi:acyl dehydratase